MSELTAKRNIKGRVSKFTKDYAIVVAILLLMVIFTLRFRLLSIYRNIRNIFMQTASSAIVCIGQALIVTTGSLTCPWVRMSA